MVTGTLLNTAEFRNFYVLVITVTPLIFKINVTFFADLFLYTTHSAAATKVSSSHVKMGYAMRSSTLPENLFTLTVYAENL